MARPKGVPNFATHNARVAIAQFVDENSWRLKGWLDEVAAGVPQTGPDGVQMTGKRGEPLWVREPDPLSAAHLFVAVIEYHVPKLARSEVTGPNGGPVKVQSITVKLPTKPEAK